VVKGKAPSSNVKTEWTAWYQLLHTAGAVKVEYEAILERRLPRKTMKNLEEISPSLSFHSSSVLS
jgi:hypothetical protein